MFYQYVICQVLWISCHLHSRKSLRRNGPSCWGLNGQMDLTWCQWCTRNCTVYVFYLRNYSVLFYPIYHFHVWGSQPSDFIDTQASSTSPQDICVYIYIYSIIFLIVELDSHHAVKLVEWMLWQGRPWKNTGLRHCRIWRRSKGSEIGRRESPIDVEILWDSDMLNLKVAFCEWEINESLSHISWPAVCENSCKAPMPTSRENWLTEIAPWEKSRTASEEWLRKRSKNDVNPHDIFNWHFLTMYGMASHVCTTTGSFGRGRSSKAPGGAVWAWIGGQKLEPVFLKTCSFFL